MEVFCFRDEYLQRICRAPVRIFLECRIYHAHTALHLLHKALDQLCRAIAGNNVFLLDTEAFTGEERVDIHARWILCQEGVKICPHLILEAF